MKIKRKKLTIHDSEAWAVSYADLLMVLLSFFVVFFNINDDSHVNSVYFKRLASELSHIAESTPGSRSPSEANSIISHVYTHGETHVNNYMNETVLDHIKAIHTSPIKEGIVYIDLPEDIFTLGSFSLTTEIQDELKRIFDIILPYKHSYNIVFIGHTDQINFKTNDQAILNSNLVLSSLRAAQAVEFALKSGFDENQIFAQGITGNPRNTRSLSLKLVLK